MNTNCDKLYAEKSLPFITDSDYRFELIPLLTRKIFVHNCELKVIIVPLVEQKMAYHF